MKCGVIARADGRGLSHVTLEAVRHLEPERVLLVEDPSSTAAGFELHTDWYPGAGVVTYEGGRLEPESLVRSFLDGLDCLYTVEVFYDRRIHQWAKRAGVRTICHVMPELWPTGSRPRPDVLWLPTGWHADRFPDARLVPVPVATEHFRGHAQRPDARTFLHRIGRPAAHDRNGTDIFLDALALVSAPMRVLIDCIDLSGYRDVPVSPHVDLSWRIMGQKDYWVGYGDADVLVMPRKYGGLSLIANEAAAAGCALLLSDAEPNPSTWPGRFVASKPEGSFRSPAGKVPLHIVDPAELAAAMDSLVTAPDETAALSRASLAWAEAHSWDALLPLYEQEFERACS